MKEQYISALMVAPGLKPTPIRLENTLEALQQAVSLNISYRGLIEIIPLETDVCLVCNEEGKFLSLPGNRRLGNDIITGVFYVVGSNDEGDLTSLPHDAMSKYTEVFKTPESFSDSEVASSIFFDFKSFY